MKEKIIEIIKEINPYEEFGIDTDLLESGVLDSMGFLALITELEGVFDIEIDEEDGIYEKLKCVKLVIEYITKKIIENNKMQWNIKSFYELSIDELYEILKFRNEIFIVEKGNLFVEIDGDDKCSYHVFLEDLNGQIFAYGRAIPENIVHNIPTISRIVVHDIFRSTNISSVLLNKVIEVAKEKFNTEEVSTATSEYVAFYEKLGFKNTNDTFVAGGKVHYRMIYPNNSNTKIFYVK